MAKSVTEKTTLVKLDSPKQVAAFAKELKGFIVANNLYTLMGENEEQKAFSHVEAWQFAGASMGIFFIPVSEENVSPETGEVRFKTKYGDRTNPIFKYKVVVEAVQISTGRVVGRGVAICSNQEWNKKTFDEYAVLSMAQTRAIGKAGRNTLGWVMKLAGYEPTPAEEIDSVVVEEQPTQSEPNISMEEMTTEVFKHIKTLSATDKMRFLKTVNKVNDNNLSEPQLRQLYYAMKGA